MSTPSLATSSLASRLRAARFPLPRRAELALALSALFIGCSASSGEPEHGRATATTSASESATATTTASGSTSSASSSASTDSAPTATTEAEPERFQSTTPELARFHAALHDLETKRRSSHVRIFWLGDSHGAADFWSGELRTLLAERFGAAGPGYVHLGYKDYRHDGVKLDIRGKWKMRPKGPADPEKKGDGVWGLGGIMMAGYADDPGVTVRLTEPPQAERVRYDVCYRLTDEGDTLEVRAEHGEPVKVSTASIERGKIQHLSLEAAPDDRVFVVPTGNAFLCGATIETDPAKKPGVVLDTLSINGARYMTALSWDEDAWLAEAARRPPDLVVFEYGTNEAGGLEPPFTKIRQHMADMLARVRKVSKDVDCVVVSPTDRADAEDKVEKMHASLERVAHDQGCYFFDVWKLLGGKGAAARLRDQPSPSMQADGIHLKPDAYRDVGKTMFKELLAGYGKPPAAAR
ncbi:MAG: GDSL-type esterase/lipase family protein [Polyangiaceae bacterium]